MKFSPKCRVLCLGLKSDREQHKKDRGAAGEGKRGGPPLHIGLAGALTAYYESEQLLNVYLSFLCVIAFSYLFRNFVICSSDWFIIVFNFAMSIFCCSRSSCISSSILCCLATSFLKPSLITILFMCFNLLFCRSLLKHYDIHIKNSIVQE